MSVKRKILFYVLGFLLATVIAFAAGEVLAGRLWKYPYLNDERNLCYRYDAELGWFPISNSVRQFKGVHTITVRHNKDGFRDRNHGSKDKKRIVFLGDSFVWGYDVEQQERFTDKLQLLMPDYEIMNMGVSGYGTDQEFILLQKWFDRYRADIVIVLFTESDPLDNSSGYVYNGYYKPYFDFKDGQLALKGVPVSKSLNYYCSQYPILLKSHLLQQLIKRYETLTAAHPSGEDVTFEILKAMKTYVESRGAKFKLLFAFNFDYEKRLSFCRSSGIDYLFLGENEMLPEGGHWSPKGNDSVCNKVYSFLKDTKKSE